MEPVGPRPFTNWGDWLIQRSTGFLGDFRMGTCCSILRSERFSRGWVEAMSSQDIMRVLARYKEHVIFWGIRPDIIEKELREFADAGGWDQNHIISLYNDAPPRRYPFEYTTARW